jgi:hypothetical protein
MEADFGGFADNGVTQTSGYPNVPGEGGYVRRLTSDDGSRLAIDDAMVIDHDGPHGAEPEDGTVHLTRTRSASTTWSATAGRSCGCPGARPALPTSPSYRTRH